jgi:hypothetical protein
MSENTNLRQIQKRRSARMFEKGIGTYRGDPYRRHLLSTSARWLQVIHTGIDMAFACLSGSDY